MKILSTVTFIILSLIISTQSIAQCSSVTRQGTVAGSSGSGGGWSPASDVLSVDGHGAMAAALILGGTSEYLTVTHFGFSIPSGNNICGITVTVNRRRASGSGTVRDNEIRIMKGGAISGDDNADGSTNWSTSFSSVSYGGNDWGLPWTVSDINDPGFGVAISAQYIGLVLPVAEIDYVGLTVYYSAILPVTVSSFTVADNNNGALLRWSTSSEHDNEYFQIERSNDGENFYSIARIKGNGNSNVVHHYQYSDNAAYSSVYYRLKQVDHNGSFTYSQVVSYNSDTFLNDLNLYPNPAYENLFIDISSMGEVNEGQILIYDHTGRIISEIILGNQDHVIEFSLKNFSQGSYCLVFRSTEKSISKKFIIS